ncbi:unnamed protein product, partial [Cyprideis torosa]
MPKARRLLSLSLGLETILFIPPSQPVLERETELKPRNRTFVLEAKRSPALGDKGKKEQACGATAVAGGPVAHPAELPLRLCVCTVASPGSVRCSAHVPSFPSSLSLRVLDGLETPPRAYPTQLILQAWARVAFLADRKARFPQTLVSSGQADLT